MKDKELTKLRKMILRAWTNYMNNIDRSTWGYIYLLLTEEEISAEKEMAQ